MNLFPDPWPAVLAVVALVAAGLVVLRHRGGRRQAVPRRRLVLALVLVAVALRPVVGTSTTVSYSSGVDVVIMIDRTASMAAEDHAGGRTRLEGMKDDLARLVASVEGSRFAVVVFDNGARVALPYSTDAAAVVSLADAIGWREAAFGTGSDIAAGVPVAQALLERSHAERPEVGRYLVYVGDGEQTIEAPPGSFAPLSPFVDGGLVLGYGTASGGVMREREGSDTYVTHGGERATSVIDQDNLRRIAEEVGVPYRHRTADTDLSLPVSGAVLVPTERRDPRGFELYWVLAGVALLVLAVDLWDGLGRLRRAQEELR